MEHAEHEVIGSKATEPNSNIATSQYTFPTLPQDLHKYIIQLIEDSEEEVFQQIVQLQALAEVSKEIYLLIAQRLAEESRKHLKFIPKLLEIEKNKIGLVGILHRYHLNIILLI